MDRPWKAANLFEFGAGWDLPIQLLFFAKGATHQVIVDQAKLIRKELVNDSIKRIRNLEIDSLERLPERMIETNIEAELRRNYGIDYKAPCDVRNADLPQDSVDMVTSTETLQHIPCADLFQILCECFRILRPGGLISSTITYDDHYSFSDNRISPYNFLQFSDRQWKFYNPPNHYQSRLRHVDYIALFQRAGFQLIEETPRHASEAELELLTKLRIDPRFRRYAPRELAIHDSHMVFVKTKSRKSFFAT
jgi:SAM-dependent methyltransferase